MFRLALYRTPPIPIAIVHEVGRHAAENASAFHVIIPSVSHVERRGAPGGPSSEAGVSRNDILPLFAGWQPAAAEGEERRGARVNGDCGLWRFRPEAQRSAIVAGSARAAVNDRKNALSGPRQASNLEKPGRASLRLAGRPPSFFAQ